MNSINYSPYPAPHCFRPVPRTGVIFVMTEAGRVGFFAERDKWSNLGQGAPETGPLPGSPDRITTLAFNVDDHEYAPVVGLDELRDAVAELYNQRYRQGKASKYTRDNVAICSGGRLALTRLVTTIGRANVGHFLPDYTAYEELLESFGTFVPIPILLDPDEGYLFSAEQFEREILGRGLSAVLMSNPCNPTGSHVRGDMLGDWVAVGRKNQCTLIFDEFYSHYLYDSPLPYESAARYIDDVNTDPVVVFDGLTKNWRYPGFRVCWTVGPPAVIEALASAGSFLDGGCARPMQIAALQLIKREVADAEAAAVQQAFSHKRTRMLAALREMGVVIDPEPVGGFYCWGDLRALPEGLNTGMKLFRRCLEEKVVIVPGVFFDINPGKRRPDRASRFGQFARFSFGPPLAEVEQGLAAMRRLF